MHSVGVTLIADQEIEIGRKLVNVHDLYSIMVNARGVIVNAYVKPDDANAYSYMKESEGFLLDDKEEEGYKADLKAKNLE